MTTWTYHDATKSQSAAAVATVFGASVFDPPRDLDSCWGSWLGSETGSGIWDGRWEGRFRLKGGWEVYLIDRDAEGRWEVVRL